MKLPARDRTDSARWVLEEGLPYLAHDGHAVQYLIRADEHGCRHCEARWSCDGEPLNESADKPCARVS